VDPNKTQKIGGLEEENEVTSNTRKIGAATYQELQPTVILIQKEQTSRNYEEATMRIGQDKETTVVGELWDYYTKFDEDHLPSADQYFGGEEAELKITVLLRLFQKLYHERIYPPSFPAPIIHYFYRKSKTKTPKKAKFFIAGDTHGSFKDTVRMIKFFTKWIEQGKKEDFEVRIVFIGDFVDRHPLDIHNLLFILTFNLKYPDNVLLLRGNHEEVTINANYGFGNNVMKHFNKILYANFNNIFMDLPLICIFHCNEGNVMCLHGGIPIIVNPDTNAYEVPVLNTVAYKNRQIFIDDMDSITQQLLWNDPIITDQIENIPPFLQNRRGLGYIFGQEVFDQFCRINDVTLVFRGHQVFPEGMRKFFNGRFITVFSASDYANKKISARFVEMNSEDILNFEDYIIQDDPRIY
jgi:diadenosine tetraphosphatase ApaH/serine/threonine PP2A family protein phosphatase